MFCGLVIFIKYFDPINIRRHCVPKISSKVIMTKTFIRTNQKQEALATYLISYLFNKAFLVLGRSFFTPGVSLFRFIYFTTLVCYSLGLPGYKTRRLSDACVQIIFMSSYVCIHTCVYLNSPGVV